MKSSRIEFRLATDAVHVLKAGQPISTLSIERSDMWFDTFQYGDSTYYITPRGSLVRMVAVRQCKYQWTTDGQQVISCPHFLEDPLGTYCTEHEALIRERVVERAAQEAATEAADSTFIRLIRKLGKDKLAALLKEGE